MNELLVFLVVAEWDDRYPVVQLQGKGVHCVVDDQSLVESSIQNSQVLYVYTLLRLEAVLSEESVRDEGVSWI